LVQGCFVFGVVQNFGHFLVRETLGACVGHGKRALDGVWRKQRVGVRRGGFFQEIDSECVDSGSGWLGCRFCTQRRLKSTHNK